MTESAPHLDMPTPDAPPSPEDECAVGSAARLGALAGTGLMDSPGEEPFERLTRIARRLLRVPVALVSLVDADRQFFKAGARDLPAPYDETRQTPLSMSFCRHVVARRAPMVVPDARRDPALRSNLAILSLGVVAYLGVPLETDGGHVIGSLCAIDRVPRDWSDDDVEALAEVAASVMTEIRLRGEIDRVTALEAVMRERQSQLDLARSASGTIGTWGWDVGSETVTMDRHFAAIFGVDPARAESGLPLATYVEAIHPEDRAGIVDRVARAVAEGGVYFAEHRLLGADGREVWVESHGHSSVGADGRPARFVGIVLDVTARRREAEHHMEMARELGHRMKNLLQTVQAVVTQTLRESPDTAVAAKAIMTRIHAMATAQDLLTATGWAGSQLSEVVAATTGTFGPSRFDVSGPDVFLRPRSTLAFSMALHELATNAVKYGALSVPGGRVSVTWDSPAEDALAFEWAETGGPEVAEPSRKGFGTRLLRRVLAAELGGEVDLSYDPSGLRCRIAGTATR